MTQLLAFFKQHVNGCVFVYIIFIILGRAYRNYIAIYNINIIIIIIILYYIDIYIYRYRNLLILINIIIIKIND